MHEISLCVYDVNHGQYTQTINSSWTPQHTAMRVGIFSWNMDATTQAHTPISVNAQGDLAGKHVCMKRYDV
jgi:hypothetical protein